jgi:DNA invertase Pin-like site-specific DNA recombinase
MTFAYTRISTKNQSSDLQITDLKKHGFDELFEDCISGKKFIRPGFDAMMNKLRENDIVIIWRLDRLGRSLIHVLKIVEDFKSKGVNLISLKDNIDTRTATGRLLLGFMATLSEYELELLAERRMAGIDEARRRGVQLGRRKGLSEEALKKVKLVKKLHKDQNYTVEQLLNILKISRKTYYKYLIYKDE